MCFFCTQKPAIHCSFIDWDHFCLKMKLWILRGCAWIYVGCFVCKLAGLKAHADHQIPSRVALHGKTAYVGLDHQPLHRFTSFLFQWYLLIKTAPWAKIGWVGGEMWRISSEKWKVGSTPRQIRHWSPSWLQSSSGAISRSVLPLGPELDCSQLGDQCSIQMQKHPHLGPHLIKS